jgi:hypothetical protein
MDDKYKEYLLSNEWKEFRKKALEHHGKKCSKCDRTKNLQIHHLHYRNIFHEQLEDVIVLCRKHHEQEHGIYDPIKPTIKQKVKKSKRKKQKKINQGKRKAFKYRKVKDPKPIKTKFPAIDAIIQKKQERERWRMRVV